MSRKVPSLSYEKIIRVLQRDGWIIVRQRGSHIRLQKRTGNETLKITVPAHKPIKRSTLSHTESGRRVPVRSASNPCRDVPAARLALARLALARLLRRVPYGECGSDQPDLASHPQAGQIESRPLLRPSLVLQGNQEPEPVVCRGVLSRPRRNPTEPEYSSARRPGIPARRSPLRAG